MKRFFEKSLKIYEHEVARFTWLAVIFFAVFFVTAIFRNYVDTAFLKRYGPEYIPWMLVISALLTMVVLVVVVAATSFCSPSLPAVLTNKYPRDASAAVR